MEDFDRFIASTFVCIRVHCSRYKTQKFMVHGSRFKVKKQGTTEPLNRAVQITLNPEL
jgi:hypothetical protein